MSEDEKKIGLIIGREWSWPSAFISEVNKREEGVTAEFIKLSGTFMDQACQYDVIIDRMSHEIPYYRAFLKYAALEGTYIVNNPFTWAADDKFFGVVLANKIGLRTPRTIVLPNKRVEAQTVPESFRNLDYPMDWRGIIDYVGVPAILKDAITGGRRIAHRVHNVDDLIQKYDESDTLTVVLQQIVETDTHIHCFSIGREAVLPVRYSPEENVYRPDDELDPDLAEEAAAMSRKICTAYGYDMNMVEFVVEEGALCVINPTNPAPDMDINVLKPNHFAWCVTTMADFAIRTAKESRAQFRNKEWYGAITAAEDQG